MALAKALIQPDNMLPIPVLFNPNQYSLDGSNRFAEIGIPGLGSPILQYVSGNARMLTMELFFDTYELKWDVRAFTDRVYGLLAINPPDHVPPICTFIWGTFQFRCVVERVGGRFTLFLADGTPVRATLNVTFKEYTDIAIAVQSAPTQSSDHAKVRNLGRGDTLSGLAAAEYGDPAKWRPIAEANHIDNPRSMEPGRLLVIPPLA